MVMFPVHQVRPKPSSRHSERGKKTRRTKEEVGRQHQGMDRPGVRQVPEGSGEQGKLEKTGWKIICGAPTTLAVKGLMMMMMIKILFSPNTWCTLWLNGIEMIWSEVAAKKPVRYNHFGRYDGYLDFCAALINVHTMLPTRTSFGGKEMVAEKEFSINNTTPDQGSLKQSWLPSFWTKKGPKHAKD